MLGKPAFYPEANDLRTHVDNQQIVSSLGFAPVAMSIITGYKIGARKQDAIVVVWGQNDEGFSLII